jgi:hypothetical protein
MLRKSRLRGRILAVKVANYCFLPGGIVKALLFAGLLAAASARASVFLELSPTGDSLVTASSVSASTRVIFGELFPDARGGQQPNIADLYRIRILDPAYFFAFTVGGGGAIEDPQLFLFDSTGRGVIWNSDVSVSPVDTQAALGPLPAGYLPGIYYLGISFFGVDPFSDAGFIFDIFSPGGEAVGPGAADPLAGWDSALPSPIWDVYGYEIRLVQVPEPSALLLIAPPLALMARRRRRRS